MIKDDKKHKYCETRLDTVKSWNVVQKNELIIKLNYFKKGIKEGERICGYCTDRARRLKKMETTIENVINNNNLIETIDISMVII